MDRIPPRLARFISWHRRTIAAVLAGVTAMLIFSQLTPSGADLVDAVVLARARTQGDRLAANDVRLARLPRSSLPEDHVATPDEAVGRVVGVGLSPGTVLQPGLLSPAPTVAEGRSLTPIQLADPSLAEVLAPGMSVTLVLTETSEVVVSNARITTLTADEDSGPFRVGSSSRPLILLDVPAESAPTVSALGQTGQLSVVIET